MDELDSPREISRVRRQELRDFLRTRRAGLSPADVGLRTRGRRRTPGLRREEVAVIANVGVSWYTALEQGKEIRVSERVLDSVSRALCLNDAERIHLYHLVGLNPPRPVSGESTSNLSRLQRIADRWLPNPAYVLDFYWNVVAGNEVAYRAFDLGVSHNNCLFAFFVDIEVSDLYPQSEEMGRELVAQLCMQAARYPGDLQLDELVSRLSAASPRFAELWERHEITETTRNSLWFRHPVVGDLFFNHVALNIAGQQDYRLMLYMPEVATDTEQRLKNLCNWSGTDLILG